MIIETKHATGFVRDGVAEIEACGPFSLGVWNDLVRAAELAARDPFVEVLCVRGRFDGAELEHDRRALWDAGRDLLRRWLALPIPTVVVVSGAASGAGWEFVQAFDLRLAVAGPDSWFHSPTLPAWIPMRRTEKLTAREAVRAGRLDDAFCERVARIETRLHLDRLLRRPIKRRPRLDLRAAWALRSAYLDADVAEIESPSIATATPPATVVAIDGGSLGAAIAVETVLRGGTATIWNESQETEADSLLKEAVRRGRVTPLEAEQARKRLDFGPDSPRLIEARRVVTARPQAVEFLRKRLHPWAIVADLSAPDDEIRAWCRALHLAIPRQADQPRYSADAVATKIAS